MNYEEYHFTKKEFYSYLLQGMALYGAAAYVFYQEILMVFLSFLFSILYVRKKKQSCLEKRKEQLNQQFKDGIISLSNALNAGYSIENAFVEAIQDLISMYGEEAYLVKEFRFIVAQIRTNRTVEEALYDLGSRSGIEDIRSFSEIFSTAKRTGGDIMKIIHTTGRNMGDKIEIKREIQTLITAKKFEARIMNIIPFGIILYFMAFSPEFLTPLYHNLIGMLIMTAALAVYCAAVLLSEKIMNIEV